jgi:hypothetical protein
MPATNNRQRYRIDGLSVFFPITRTIDAVNKKRHCAFERRLDAIGHGVMLTEVGCQLPLVVKTALKIVRRSEHPDASIQSGEIRRRTSFALGPGPQLVGAPNFEPSSLAV